MAKRKQSTNRTSPQEVTSADTIPPKEVLPFVALVDPSGGGGGAKLGRQKEWSFTAKLVAWRCSGGPIVRESIIVTDSKISEIKLTNRMKQFPSWSIVKFTARRVPRASRGRGPIPTIKMVKFLGKGRDSGLEAIEKDLQQPLGFDDSLFGSVIYNRQTRWFESNKFADKEGIGLIFEAETVEDAKALVHDAKVFWQSRDKWFRQFKKVVYDQMFDDCSDSWSGADGTELTERRFFELLGNPCMITFYKVGDDVGFNLGGWSDDLFGDHGVEVSGTLTGGLRRS